MIKLKKYNPCEKQIEYYKSLLEKLCEKPINILYDKQTFITNISRTDLINSDVFKLNNISFNEKGLIILRAEGSFFREEILLCPQMKFYNVQDLYLEGILKRMFAQMQFGFLSEDTSHANFNEICDCIFKSIYSNSLKIKLKYIENSLELFNEVQKTAYINRHLIYGIIYALYDYYNFALKEKD